MREGGEKEGRDKERGERECVIGERSVMHYPTFLSIGLKISASTKSYLRVSVVLVFT